MNCRNYDLLAASAGGLALDGGKRAASLTMPGARRGAHQHRYAVVQPGGVHRGDDPLVLLQGYPDMEYLSSTGAPTRACRLSANTSPG